MTKSTEIDDKSMENHVKENEWAIRPCFLYKEEYNDCRSIKARFQQYFVYGDSIDCLQWKRDYEHCVEYEESADMKSAVAVIDSESNRRQERIRAHFANDVWQKRKEPPGDWSKPLPEWMEKRMETSLFRGTKTLDDRPVESSSMCVIM